MKTRYRVKVNDKRREWSVSCGGDGKDGNDAYCYVPSPLLPPEDPTHVMGDEAEGQIAGRLADHDALRKKKEYQRIAGRLADHDKKKYQRADAILDELKERYSVVVDNTAKEWKVVLGNIEDDAFAMEAQLSRRSAFMRRGNNVEGLSGGGYRYSCGLREVHFSACRIGTQGCYAIEEALKRMVEWEDGTSGGDDERLSGTKEAANNMVIDLEWNMIVPEVSIRFYFVVLQNLVTGIESSIGFHVF